MKGQDQTKELNIFSNIICKHRFSPFKNKLSHWFKSWMKMETPSVWRTTFTIILNRQNVRETLFETNSWRIILGHRYRKQHTDKVVEYTDEQLKVKINRSILSRTEISVNPVIKYATLYNRKIYIEDITRWREDMNFIFELQNNILRTSAASE